LKLCSTATLTVLALTAAGCGGGSSKAGDSKTGGEKAGTTVVIATHDSWAMSKKVMAEFTRQTGITVKTQQHGDAGELTNKLVLTKDHPLADGVFGIDNTFASRAVDEGVLAKSSAQLPASAKQFALDGDAADYLTPIDYGDVCVNIDDGWFAQHHVAPPKTFDDLVKPAYKGLLVAPGATTSSPGLAFLVATIGTYGDGWKDYWKKLVANGVKIDSGWEDAYTVDFTQGGGHGDRPIVVSYSSSPPFTIPKGADKPTTSALLGTCFRQVEYAGVLKGASNPKGAQEFIDFMLQKQFQAALPDNMYVYPVDTSVALPADWAKWAPTSPHPVAMSPADITAHRAEWLRDWRDIASQ
jgi:thiamine transport system substrate-binding protein